MLRAATLLFCLTSLACAGSVSPTSPGANTSASTSTPAPDRMRPPVIGLFSIDQIILNPGESTTLRWEVLNAVSVSLNEGIGTVPEVGTTMVSPTETQTVYTLTAANPDGIVAESITVRRGARPIG